MSEVASKVIKLLTILLFGAALLGGGLQAHSTASTLATADHCQRVPGTGHCSDDLECQEDCDAAGGTEANCTDESHPYPGCCQCKI